MKRIIAIVLFVCVSMAALPAKAAFDVNLKYGIKHSEDVRELQEFLTDQGAYSGPITGNFFSLTLKGVKNFQNQSGFLNTGFWGNPEREAAKALIGLETSDAASEGQVIPTQASPIVFCFADGSCVDAAGNVVKQIARPAPVTETPLIQPAPVVTPVIATPVIAPTRMLYLQVPAYQSPSQQNAVYGNLNLDALNASGLNLGWGYVGLITNNPVSLSFTFAPYIHWQGREGTSYPAYEGMNGDAIRQSIQSSQPSDTVSYDDNTLVTTHNIPDNILGIKPDTSYLYKIVATDAAGNKTTLVNFDNGSLIWH